MTLPQVLKQYNVVKHWFKMVYICSENNWMRETPLTAVIVNIVAIVCHAVRYANELHKIQLSLEGVA